MVAPGIDDDAGGFRGLGEALAFGSAGGSWDEVAEAFEQRIANCALPSGLVRTAAVWFSLREFTIGGRDS